MSNIRERLLGTSNNNVSNIRERLGINKKNILLEKKNQLTEAKREQSVAKNELGKFLYNNNVSANVNSFSTQKTFQNRSDYAHQGFNSSSNKNTLLENKKNDERYNQIKKNNNYRELENNLIDKSNEVGYAQYNYDKQKVDNESINLYDKTIGRLNAGVKSLFDYNGGLIKNSNGDLEYLPTYNQIKQQKISESYETGIGKFFGDALYETGKIAGSTLVNSILPGVGSTMYFGKMFVDSTNQAISDGYDSGSATLYGLVNVGLEYGVGKMLGSATKGLTGGKNGDYEELLKKTFTSITKKPKISKILANAGSEATEEFVQEYLDNISKLLILDKNTNIKDYASVFLDGDVLSDALYSAAIGGVTGGIIGTITDKDTNVENKDVNLYKTFKEELEETKKNTTNKETVNKINTIISNIDSTINNNSNVNADVDTITSQINEYETLKEQNKLTSEQEIELNELKNQLSAVQNQNTGTSTSIKEEVNLPTVQDIVNQEKLSQSGINLSIYNQQSNTNNSDKAILPTVNDFDSPNINMPTSDIKIDMTKIKPEILNDIKGFKLGDPSIESYKGSYIKTMLNEVGIKVPAAMNYVSEVRPDMSFTTTKDLTRQQYASIGNALQKLRSVDVTSVNNANYSIPIGNYQYVKSSNVNINELRRTASMYLNNTARSNNTIRLLENIIKDRNYTIRFNPNITNEQGVPVNGLITKENGKTIIELNPNADNYVEFLVVHEITHDIATKEMKELILDYAKQDPEFEKSLESLKERYKTNDVSDEVVADVCGELFGNREFIQSVVEKKPNIFKKILNNIRKLAEKIKDTGINEYVNFVEKLKTMWEDAYYSNRSNLKDKMFSIQQDSKGNKYVEVDTNQDIFEGKSISEQVKIAKQYILNNFRENGIDINDENIKVTSKTANEYTHPKNQLPTTTKSSKMKASTELDNLLLISNYKYSKPDDGRHPFAKDGWDYYETTFKVGDNLFNGLVNIAKSENKKTLYDITNIKRIDQNRSTSANAFTTSLVNSVANNIPQSDNNVNSGTSSTTKYSIPINKNNAKELENSSFLLKNSEGNDIDITNLKENDSMLRMHYKRGYDKNTVKAYRGVSENTGSNGAFYGLGLYTTLDKNYAKKYGEVFEVDNNLLPNNPLMFKTQNDFQIWEQLLAQELNIRKSKLYSNNYGVEQYIKRLGYDGLMIGSGKDTDLISFKDVSKKYSQSTKEWNDYLKDNFLSAGTKTKMSDIKLPVREDIESSSKKSKILNPNEISKLTKEDANTTPILPVRANINKVNDGDSHFAKNIKDKVNMLNVEQKAEILSKEDVRYYDKVTNKESLGKAFKRLNDGGKAEVTRWFNNNENIDSSDVAEGYILLKQYSDKAENAINLAEKDDYNKMVVETAKKMRKLGTIAGQTVQAFNIMERMTPEGMVKYAQSELSEAYDRMVKNKSKEWIDKYREDFDLKPDEVKFIMDTMQEVQNMEDGYDKRVKLAEIQKLMTDKLPPEKGAKIKSWMRISMLFNPKTQVRNVAGNALIMPVNSFGDLFSSYADKLIAKKTGVRTIGTTNIKAMLKGIKKGAYEATNDYKKGINTKDMEGNRFEISDGKSFSEKNLMGRTLNRTESLLNYVMDVGDRVFSEAAFENSLQNQLVLNNTTEITQEMIDIAHQEALSRTWNDNNNYTGFVLGVRKILNKLNVNGYGLGDVLIPFAKTPANLTKAIVDYSPAGLVSTINKGINLKRSLTNGQYTATMQHEFVQSLGKATAGTMLYILGIALAKAGITSGDSDDDKDTANFLKNTLGINSYSIKIGGKSFTYDWAQPLAAPLSITANVVNSKSGDSKALLEGIFGSLDSAGSILLEQSFLQSINDVLNDNDGVASGIINEILELPARAVPTFSKQIADLVDGTQRTSFEYGKPIQSAVNSIKSKIPFVSKTLNPTVDTMGREIQKYGGKNNIFNVFLNPANVSTENISESAEEIYRLYKETGETNIMPRVAPYYINQKGEKITMTGEERTKYQKISGMIIEDSVNKLLKNNDYQQLNNTEKADIINKIVNYSYNKAREEVLGIEMSNEYNKINSYVDDGGNVADYYLNKKEINYSYSNPGKYKTITQITSYNDYLSYKENIDTIKEKFTNSSQRKAAVIKYVNSLDLTIPQKAMLIKMNYSSYNVYNNQIINYINKQSISLEDKKEILEELGFKVRNGKVYTK